MTLVTLLTDFGTADTYVGQVRGVILGLAPEVRLVDLTHAVPPHDVAAGAFLLWSGVEAFPAGTVHLAVVDPGVGSARRAIALATARGDRLVGPDNGLLLPAAERLGGVSQAVELSNPSYWRPTPTRTFHGRDIFGPVAAHLALGVPLEDLGGPITDLINTAAWPPPDGLKGQVIHVDTYGNLVTNIPASALPPRFHARVGEHRARSAAFYAEAQPGELIVLPGSAGLLEISALNASAARMTGATRGTPVTIEPE